MRVLITGRDGQVGGELHRLLRDRVDAIATGREELDLARPDRIVAVLRETRPDLILNAAAYTAVDRAEREPDQALAVNAHAPRILGEEGRRLGAPVIHYSTDYVFAGAGAEPHREDDAPAPLGVYGKSKLLGERALASSGVPSLILRVAWVYGAGPGNFLTTMLDLMRERTEVRVVEDEIGTPTWCRDIARTTLEILRSAAGPADRWRRGALAAALRARGGVYHMAPQGETSWHGFAEEIRRRAPECGLGPLAIRRLTPIPAAEWPSATRRPANSRLSCERLSETFGVRLPDWREGVGACLQEMAAGRAAAVV